MTSPIHPSKVITLLIPMAMAIVAGALLALSFHPVVRKRLQAGRTRLVLAITAYIITRPTLFLVIYVIMGNREIGNDLKSFHMQATSALAGELLYRDFPSWHSPLFPYLIAIPYTLWNHKAAVVLLFICFDLVCMLLLCKLTRMTLGRGHVMDMAWLWVMNPAVWIIIVRYGQDEGVIASFILLATYLQMKESKWCYGLTLALGILFTKATVALGMVVVFAYGKAKLRHAVVAIGLLAAVYVPFELMGADILTPFKDQLGGTAGIGITHLLRTLVVPASGVTILQRTMSVITILATVAVLFVAKKRRIPLIEALPACLLVFYVFVPVSYKFYHLWALGPLGIYCLKTNHIGRYILYGVLLCVVDDFSLKQTTPFPILYAMTAAALAVAYIEISYVFEILSRKAKTVAGACGRQLIGNGEQDLPQPCQPVQ